MRTRPHLSLDRILLVGPVLHGPRQATPLLPPMQRWASLLRDLYNLKSQSLLSLSARSRIREGRGSVGQNRSASNVHPEVRLPADSGGRMDEGVGDYEGVEKGHDGHHIDPFGVEDGPLAHARALYGCVDQADLVRVHDEQASWWVRCKVEKLTFDTGGSCTGTCYLSTFFQIR